MTSPNWLTFGLLISGSLVGAFLQKDASSVPTPPEAISSQADRSQAITGNTSPQRIEYTDSVSEEPNQGSQTGDSVVLHFNLNTVDDELTLTPVTWTMPAPDQHMVEATVLGVHVSKTNPVLRKHLKINGEFGMVIDHIEPESAAADAQLQQYDVLYEFDNQKLVNREQLTTVVRSHKPGDQVSVLLFREGQPMQLDVVLKSGQVPAHEDQPVLHESDMPIHPHNHMADVRFRRCTACHSGPVTPPR
jgi:hypothetical protein